MWSLSAWRRRRILARHPIADDLWQRVRHHLSFLDGISAAEDQWLREASVLFLEEKHLTALPGVELHQEQRLLLAAQAQLPLLNLGDLNWYQGFHEIVLYPTTSSVRNAIAMPSGSSTSGTASTAAKPGNRGRSSSPGRG